MPRKQYTEARSLVLQAIREFQTRNGRLPSYREIGAAVGIASPSTVKFHIDSLLQDGLIERAGERGFRLTGCDTEDFMQDGRWLRVCFTCRAVYSGSDVDTWMESHRHGKDK